MRHDGRGGWSVLRHRCRDRDRPAGGDDTGARRTGDVLGGVRERELRVAAAALGIAEVEMLGFADSGGDGPAPVNALSTRVRRPFLRSALLWPVIDLASWSRSIPLAPTGIATTRPSSEPPPPRLLPDTVVPRRCTTGACPALSWTAGWRRGAPTPASTPALLWDAPMPTSRLCSTAGPCSRSDAVQSPPTPARVSLPRSVL